MESQLDKIQDLEENGEQCPDVLKLLDRFETRRRIGPPTKVRSQPVFATLQGKSHEEKKDINKKATTTDGNHQNNNLSNVRSRPSTPCPCGRYHFYSKCYYLVDSIRPAGWKPDVEILNKINDMLQRDHKFRGKVEIAKKKLLERSKPQEHAEEINNTSNRESNSNTARIASNFATIYQIGEPHAERAEEIKSNTPRIASNFGTIYQVGEAHATSITYRLKNSFLLDSASDIHVCNNFERFTTYHKTETEDYLIAGNTTVPILGYGIATVYSRTADDKDTHIINLHNTAYAPDFHTSLVSLRRAMENGVDWLIRMGLLVDKDGPICKVFDMFNQWILEYNPVQEHSNHQSDHEVFASSKKSSKKSSKPLTSAAPRDIWHKRLGHVSMEAIDHLSNALDGVKVTEQRSPPTPLPSPCEVCTIANLQYQVSRRPARRASKVFERVHFDLIQMSRAYNGDQWAMHFLCDKAQTHYGYTFANKSDARETVKDFDAFVKRQYKVEILIWHTDGEKALDKAEFDNWLLTEGFLFETTAPYSSSQNGRAERAGGLIMRKARAMRIEAKVPTDLWPEFFKSAVYIANRTPTKQLGWLTPLEVLNQELGRPNPRPIGAHLHILGCRVYNKVLNLPRKQKVAPRSLIGYLVGYDSTNIFRIWMPQKRKVIRAKDVIVDENKFYDPETPYIEEVLQDAVPGKRVTQL